MIGLLSLAACAAPTPAPAPTPPAAPTPWWRDTPPGVYRWKGEALMIAVGRDQGAAHPAARLVEAKVAAQLKLDGRVDPKAQGAPPLDVFITEGGQTWVLLGGPPKEAPTGSIRELRPPAALTRPGVYYIDGHRYRDGYHSYRECPVEGPLTNPNWGLRDAWAGAPPRLLPPLSLHRFVLQEAR